MLIFTAEHRDKIEPMIFLRKVEVMMSGKSRTLFVRVMCIILAALMIVSAAYSAFYSCAM